MRLRSCATAHPTRLHRQGENPRPQQTRRATGYARRRAAAPPPSSRPLNRYRNGLLDEAPRFIPAPLHQGRATATMRNKFAITGSRSSNKQGSTNKGLKQLSVGKA